MNSIHPAHVIWKHMSFPVAVRPALAVVVQKVMCVTVAWTCHVHQAHTALQKVLSAGPSRSWRRLPVHAADQKRPCGSRPAHKPQNLGRA